MALTDAIGEICSIGHEASQLLDRRCFGLFNVVGDYNLEGPWIEADLALPAGCVIRVLEQNIESVISRLCCVDDPESISGVLQALAEHRGIRLDCIQPGKPQQERAGLPDLCYTAVMKRHSDIAAAMLC